MMIVVRSSVSRSVHSAALDFLRFERKPGGIDALDGLRGLAILLVLARHAVRPFWSDEEKLFPVAFWDAGIPLINGWIGVDLFFVLSGFPIARHILARTSLTGEFEFGAYLGQRALRIIPAYLAVLAVVATGSIPLYPLVEEHLELRLAYHLLFLQDYLPANIVVAFWSLGVEEKFYLLAPIVIGSVLLMPSRAMRYAALIGLALLPLASRTLTLLARPDVTEYKAWFAIFRSPFYQCFDGIAIGMLCAFVFRDRAQIAWLACRRDVTLLFWIGAFGICGVLALEPLLATIDAFEKTALQSLVALGSGAMLLGAAAGGGSARFLECRLLLVFARLAYTLYLVHLSMVLGCRALARLVFGDFGGSAALDLIAFVPIFLGASLLAALAVHYLVEKPFLIIKDRPKRRRAIASGLA